MNNILKDKYIILNSLHGVSSISLATSIVESVNNKYKYLEGFSDLFLYYELEKTKGENYKKIYNRAIKIKINPVWAKKIYTENKLNQL